MKKQIHFLLPVGLVMIVFALIGLMGTPKLLQYAFQPEMTLIDMQDNIDDVRSELSDFTLTLHAVSNDVSISTEGGQSVGDVILYRVDARYNECYPQSLMSGRFIAHADIADAEHVIVLDEKLAFQLFGDKDPLEQTVSIGEKSYAVIGLVSHSRHIGEIGSYAAWVPLSCADDDTSCDVAVITAVTSGGSDVSVLFESAVKTRVGEGSLYVLSKENMRATLALRLIALVLVVRLLAIWIRLLMKLGKRLLGDVLSRLKDTYMSALIGYAAVRLLAMLALSAVTLLACWGLMTFFIQPVMVFTEWIPEVIVSFSSIQGRFWELCAAAAQPASYMTAEMAEIRFFAGFVRWGVITALIGLVMTLLTERRKQT